MAENRFNIIYEKWIPVAGRGRVSLIDVFSDDSICDLAGNAIQKIAVMKFLIAIAQAAVRIPGRKEWEELGEKGLAEASISYLESHAGCFYLYGERPFLQMPVLKDAEGAEVQHIHYDYIPDLASENDSILRELQRGRRLDDADKALFILQLMNYAPGGKRTSYIQPLTPGFGTRTKSAKAGPSLGGMYGYLQTCLKGESLRQTVWLDYFTDEDILKLHPGMKLDVRPPWERMPEGEDDAAARNIRSSVYAWLAGVSRFVLLADDGIIYTEGLQYPSVKNGYYEPFLTIRDKDGAVLYSDTSRKPWRYLPSLLQVVFNGTAEYTCGIIRLFLERASSNAENFAIWSGGLRLRATSGDQSVKQDDDYVESEIWFGKGCIGSEFYHRLSDSMKNLDGYALILRKALSRYCSKMKLSGDIPRKGEMMYWMRVEPLSDGIISACQKGDTERISSYMRHIYGSMIAVYDLLCPHETSFQRIEWRKDRPGTGKKEAMAMERSGYIGYLFSRCSSDKGFRAAMRHADNKAFGHSLPPVLLLRYPEIMESEETELIYSLIGAAVGKSKNGKDGDIGLGKAFRIIWKGKADEYSPRFRRVLSSTDVKDLAMVLRPVLSHIGSEGIDLDFSRLLSELLSFRYKGAQDRIKDGWIDDYLGRKDGEGNE